MPKIEPETFREKLCLLVIDKVVIGTLIAIAFFVYDQWKTQEVRRYTEAQEEVQLGFRRAEYVKQLVPIVLASEQDVRYRAHVLGALVETRSIDANSAVNFAKKLLDSNILGNGEYSKFATPTSEDYFFDVMRKTMPSGLQALLNEYQHIRYSRPTGHTDVGPSPLENNIRFWMRLFSVTIKDRTDSELQLLDSDTFLFKNLDTLNDILGPITSDEADKLTRRKVKGLRITASIHLLRSSGKSEPYAVMQLQAAIDPTPQNPRALAVAAKIIDLLPYDINDVACTGLSDRLLEIVLRRQDSASNRDYLKNELILVQNAAIPYVIRCTRIYPKIEEQLEPTILPVVREFFERLKGTPRGSLLESNYPVGGVFRVESALIKILMEANSVPNRVPGSETERLLSKIFSLPEDKLVQGGLHDFADKWNNARVSGAAVERPNTGMQPAH